MGSTTALWTIGLAAVSGAGLAAEANDSSNNQVAYLIAAVGALFGLLVLIAKRDQGRLDTLNKAQDQMHADNRAAATLREQAWQKREDERTSVHQTQILTLRDLSDGIKALAKNTENLPERVADEVDDRLEDRERRNSGKTG